MQHVHNMFFNVHLFCAGCILQPSNVNLDSNIRPCVAAFHHVDVWSQGPTRSTGTKMWVEHLMRHTMLI